MKEDRKYLVSFCKQCAVCYSVKELRTKVKACEQLNLEYEVFIEADSEWLKFLKTPLKFYKIKGDNKHE